MDKKVEKLTAMIKGRVEKRPTYGTDPNDPWSAKANIDESGTLDMYLKSKGIDPMRVNSQTKLSHAKSGTFAKWKQDRKFAEETELDEKTLTPSESKKKEEIVKSLKPKYGKTSKTYAIATAQAKKVAEEVEQIDEDELLNQYFRSKGLNPKTASKFSKIAASKTGDFEKWKRSRVRGGRIPEDTTYEQMSYKHSSVMRRQKMLDKSYDRLKPIRVAGPDLHKSHHGMKNEEADVKDTITMDIPLLIRILELVREDIKNDADLHRVVEKLIDIRNKGTLTMDDYDTVSNIKEQYVPEDTYQDSYAATQTTGPEITSTDDTEKEAGYYKPSKAAKMVKSLLKKTTVKEDLYDHEKEGKSVESYGKKPKIDISPIDPKSAGIIYGGKTMTQQPRDTIELDPMMKKPDVTPDFQKKANIDKKSTNDK